jgi:addiction module HigA family antidote
MNNAKEQLEPVHPGDVLLEDFMKPLGLTAYGIAKAIGATPITISLICRRKRSVRRRWRLNSADCLKCRQASGWDCNRAMTWKWHEIEAKGNRETGASAG